MDKEKIPEIRRLSNELESLNGLRKVLKAGTGTSISGIHPAVRAAGEAAMIIEVDAQIGKIEQAIADL